MQAIILAGGKGMRLRSVLAADCPKPMAPIGNKPFLAYLLSYLAQQGFSRVILSLHYQPEKIQAYFQSSYEQIKIDYVIERLPLGTGGALVYAASQLKEAGPFFVLNGDTFVTLNYQHMLALHRKHDSSFTMLLRKMPDCHRYGKVILDNGHIVQFKEKEERGEGMINAGVYLIQSDFFSRYDLPHAFSLEQDFLYPRIGDIKPLAYEAEDYFIDIGIPEDYDRAKVELMTFE